jgi:hypothetical protein
MPSLLRLTLALATLALAAGGTAAGGGWATAGLSPLPPEDVAAGDTWRPTITLLQHARTPLDGVSPSITIRNGHGETRTFVATPTGEPGKYAVDVAFPSSGSWAIAVDDDFSQVHTFGTVSVGAGGSVAGDFPLGWTLGGIVAVAAAAALLLLRRRGRPDSVAAPLPG